MSRYIAFLRGLNVGGHRIKMDHLRGLFEEMKFTDVSSFIASGNIVFEASDSDATSLEARIAAHLQASLGYEVATFLRSFPALQQIIADQPFPQNEIAVSGHSVYVMFLHFPLPEDAIDRLIRLRTERDEFSASGREFYWLSRGRLTDSPITTPMMAQAIGNVEGTMRNLNTLHRLIARFGTGS